MVNTNAKEPPDEHYPNIVTAVAGVDGLINRRGTAGTGRTRSMKEALRSP